MSSADCDVLVVAPEGTVGWTERIGTHDGRLTRRRVESPEDALGAAANAAVVCVLLDHRAAADVPAAVRRLRSAHPGIPVVLYGGSETVREDALDAGAADVIRADGTPERRAKLAANRIANVVDTGDGDAERHRRRLDALLRNSADRVSILDEEGQYTFVSPAVERLLGYDPDELLGESGFQYVHPGDLDRVRAAFERVLNDPDETHSVEYRLRSADGDWRWVASRGTNCLDDPAVNGIVVHSREITDRKRRQRRLSEERAFTESIFAALPDAFYAFDRDGNFLRWNDRFSAVTGYEDERIESMQPVEFIAPPDRDRVAEAITEVFEEDTTVTVEARFETKNGEWIPYEFTGGKVVGPDEEPLGLVGVGRDISDRKERQRRFEAVFNNTYQFIGLMDTGGTILEANETALRFGGVERDEVVGKPIWETTWFQIGQEARDAARSAVEEAAGGNPYREEITVRGAGGEEIIDFSVRPVTDEQGEVTLLIPEGRTITELKRRERHLNVLHRSLRHNLRNKMTVIGGTAEMLEEQLDAPTLQSHAEQISAAADELMSLSETAHRLSQVAIQAEAERRPVDLNRTLADVAEEVCEQYPDASIRVTAVDDLAVIADWRLGSVIAQLVENAVEHADNAEPTVEVSTETDGETVAIHVADDGPGIPADELTGITTDEEPTQLTHGSGFGLWLVRSVVDDLGGELRHEPRPSGGSILTVELPAAGSERSTAAGRQEELDGSQP